MNIQLHSTDITSANLWIFSWKCRQTGKLGEQGWKFDKHFCLSLSNFCSIECKDYEKLDKADRKITHEGDDECDKDIGPGWFRFEGKAGTRMATSCTPKDRCDTVVTSWLNGDHPTVADGQVTRQVCFHYGDNCCNWSTNIKVRNCGSYYVYHFDGVPSCNARYCGTD